MIVITEIKRKKSTNWKRRLNIAKFFLRCYTNDLLIKTYSRIDAMRLIRVREKINIYELTCGRER